MTPEELALRIWVIALAIPVYGLWAYHMGWRAGRKVRDGEVTL